MDIGRVLIPSSPGQSWLFPHRLAVVQAVEGQDASRQRAAVNNPLKSENMAK